MEKSAGFALGMLLSQYPRVKAWAFTDATLPKHPTQCFKQMVILPTLTSEWWDTAAERQIRTRKEAGKGTQEKDKSS